MNNYGMGEVGGSDTSDLCKWRAVLQLADCAAATPVTRVLCERWDLEKLTMKATQGDFDDDDQATAAPAASG